MEQFGVKRDYEEKAIKAKSGFTMLFAVLILSLAMLAPFIAGAVLCSNSDGTGDIKFILGLAAILTALVYFTFVFGILLAGFKVIRPNEALVLLLFGKYKGTLLSEGFFWVNPFCTAYNPTAAPSAEPNTAVASGQVRIMPNKKLSLKAMTLNNDKQKVNDEIGNPIEIGVIVIWRIVNTAKAVFNVENYTQFVSTQADSAIRQVARRYPYDVAEGGDEKSLRGSSLEIAEMLKNELQERVQIAGIEIMEAKIAHLAYAPEIAAAMLQRQQASAVIAARQKIVEGAVGMVETALDRLNENKVCKLDDERKAAMVSNLLVVLCGNKDAQPIVNSGTIY
ncbi:MAG: SPFH domain-containing protein [Clostridiales bacterium]|jgi:regulator of protease activity HflC (stomatin/prohibitin superfamily)|nr:SPFH domain-containing protein [Clostridiales bacterium]